MKRRTALAIVLALIVFVGVWVFVYFVEMSNTTRAVVWLVACVVILASQWIVLSGSKHLGGYFAMWTLAFVLIAIGEGRPHGLTDTLNAVGGWPRAYRPRKFAVLTMFSRELFQHSTPSVEALATSSTRRSTRASPTKIKARLADLGGTVLPGSPADFGKLIADETEKWGKVIRAANIKAD